MSSCSWFQTLFLDFRKGEPEKWCPRRSSEKKTLPLAPPGSRQKPTSRSEKVSSPGKTTSGLEGMGHLIFALWPPRRHLTGGQKHQEPSPALSPSDICSSRPCIWGNQRGKGWFAKEKPRLNNVRGSSGLKPTSVQRWATAFSSRYFCFHVCKNKNNNAALKILVEIIYTVKLMKSPGA